MTAQKGSTLSSALVISLDFELHWGVRDHLSVDQYRKNLLGVREALPGMLALFQEYGIHATWATVGFLFFETRDQLLESLPACRPAYTNELLSPYGSLEDVGQNEREDPFHFAPTLIRQILATPGQELASHTFSHYYALEPGQDEAAFAADLDAAQKAAARYGVKLQSLVLPRNQVNPAYLEACRRAGFVCYRGDAPGWFVRGVSRQSETKTRRALRFADSLVPIRQRTGFRVADCESEAPVNVPASRFLRPWTPRMKNLSGLQLRRIRQEMSQAAETGSVYHLWWHPHNFGAAPRENLARLQLLLEHFSGLRQRQGMQSWNMLEVAHAAVGHREVAVQGER